MYKKYRSKLICYERSVRWNETEIGQGGGATETEPSLSLSHNLYVCFASRIDFFFDFESTTRRNTRDSQWKDERIIDEEEEEEEIDKKILRVWCKIEEKEEGECKWKT